MFACPLLIKRYYRTFANEMRYVLIWILSKFIQSKHLDWATLLLASSNRCQFLLYFNWIERELLSSQMNGGSHKRKRNIIHAQIFAHFLHFYFFTFFYLYFLLTFFHQYLFGGSALKKNSSNHSVRPLTIRDSTSYTGTKYLKFLLPFFSKSISTILTLEYGYIR